MPRSNYIRLSSSSGEIYVLASRIKELQEIDAVFFDCDGVLIDVRKSCDATIVRTVRLLARKILGIVVPRKFSLTQATAKLRKSGGFNNDWSVSYALLLGLYAYASSKKEVDKPSTELHTPVELRPIPKDSLGLGARSINETSLWKRTSERLLQLGKDADSTGIESVTRILVAEGYGECVTFIKKLLGYPVESSVVGRAYDELFYGRELFRLKFGVDPKFSKSRGLVEKEKPLVSQKTLDLLKRCFSSRKLGIVSGRDHISASNTLGSLIKNFEQNNLIFLMDDVKHRKAGQDHLQPLLNKPNPEILIRAVSKIGPFRRCLYVGDSAEDFIMVQRANSIAPKFAFAGVYNSVKFKKETRSHFLTERADIIIPSADTLPEVFRKIGEIEK